MKKKLLIAGFLFASCGAFAQSEKKIQDEKSNAKPLGVVTLSSVQDAQISGGEQIVPVGQKSPVRQPIRVIPQSETRTVDGSQLVSAKEQISKPVEMKK